MIAYENSIWSKIMSSLDFEQIPEFGPVANLGIPGQSTAEIFASQAQKAVDLKPDLTIILAGTNDMLNSSKLSSFEKYEKDLRKLVDTILAGGSNVMLLNLPPCSETLLLTRHRREVFGDDSPGERIKKANEIIARLAAEKGLPLVDFNSAFDPDSLDAATSFLRNPANSQVDDGVHPTADGYAALARLIADKIAVDNLLHARVVCVGDSITFGAGVQKGENYPFQLGKLLY